MDGHFDLEAEEIQHAIATIESLTSFEQENHAEVTEPDHLDHGGSREDEDLARAFEESMNDRGKYTKSVENYTLYIMSIFLLHVSSSQRRWHNLTGVMSYLLCATVTFVQCYNMHNGQSDPGPYF